jgi:dipeptidyl aminopeptidase/acylaminoacyl peptidase
MPSWSPDGRRIVFDATINGDTDIYTVSSNEGSVIRMTSEPSIDRLPAWSQDGHWIYFSSDRSGREQIWKIASTGGPAVQVTRNGGAAPMESSDGQTVYYLDGPFPTTVFGTLKQISVEGGEESIVLPSARMYCWSVTKKGIFYSTQAGVDDILHRFDPITQRSSRLGRLPPGLPRGAPGRMAVSADGRWLAVNHMDGSEFNLMLVDNFR